MGLRLKNIDKVLLLDFVRITDSKLLVNRINNGISIIKMKYQGKVYELNLKWFEEPNLNNITMDEAFNYTTGLLPEDFNRQTLNNIISQYNKILKTS